MEDYFYSKDFPTCLAVTFTPERALSISACSWGDKWSSLILLKNGISFFFLLLFSKKILFLDFQIFSRL